MEGFNGMIDIIVDHHVVKSYVRLHAAKSHLQGLENCSWIKIRVYDSDKRKRYMMSVEEFMNFEGDLW